MRKFCFFAYLFNLVAWSLLFGHIWPTQLSDVNGLTVISGMIILGVIPLTYNAAFNPKKTWID